MRAILCLGLIAASVPAGPSQPEMRTYGSWHVVSISSTSGAGNDDASVILVQGDQPDVMQVSWDQGGPVWVSIDIDKCAGEEDFEASYSVPVQDWMRQSRREVQIRLRADMAGWLRQARLKCGNAASVRAFRLTRLGEAAADFHDRLRDYAGGATGR